MLKRAAAIIALLALAPLTRADDAEVKWQWRVEPAQPTVGGEAQLVFSADLPAGYILYASDFKAELGPRPARITFDANDTVEVQGPLAAVKSQRRTDKTFGTEYSYFAERAEFRQTIRVLKPGATVSGRIDAQTCQEKDGLCTLLKEPFAIRLN